MPTYPHVIGNYDPMPLEISQASGCEIFDTLGTGYLDFVSGMGAVSLGHDHPAFVQRIKDQIDRVWHVSNLYRIPDQEKVARTLVGVTFPGRVFFCNSGSEAIEAGVKYARFIQHQRGRSNKKRIISFSGAFHGRSFVAMSAVGGERYEPMEPLIPAFSLVEFNHSQALTDAMDDDVAAVLLETLQGEGGIHRASDEFMSTVQSLCRKYQALLIVDEVQCGNMRTGRYWHYQHYEGIEPDIVCTAKGLGGGFPIGATVVRAPLADRIVPGFHGSTFGGNPLAMAGADAVLQELTDETFAQHVERISQVLIKGVHGLIERFPGVFLCVRGRGLMLGISLSESIDARSFVSSLLHEQKLLVAVAAGNTIRLLPPLIVDQQHCQDALERLASAARGVEESLRSECDSGHHSFERLQPLKA